MSWQLKVTEDITSHENGKLTNDLTHVDRHTFTLTDIPCSSDKVNAMQG